MLKKLGHVIVHCVQVSNYEKNK